MTGDKAKLYDFFWMDGFQFTDEVLTRYCLSLRTKPFVILTGISGTGKTKIAQVFAYYLLQGLKVENHMAFVSVRPDWMDNRGLLGFYNPLDGSYHSTPLLDLLIRAAGDEHNPYFVILDEMNLAKVEYYFSDFLSKMESRTDKYPKGEQLELHEIEEGVRRHGTVAAAKESSDKPNVIPPRLWLPQNVFVTGTVNVDESTYMFSPKVLDRANVMEFNEIIIGGENRQGISGNGESFVLKAKDCKHLFSRGLEQGNIGDLEDLDSGAVVHQAFASTKDFEKAKRDVEKPLRDLRDILKPYHLHFGYRTINELSRFVWLAKENVENFDVDELLDIQILQKILPKFHGTRARLEKPLWKILGFCYGEAGGGEEQVGTEGEARRKRAETFDKTARHPRCAQKCARMLRNLKEQGYTSFIE